MNYTWWRETPFDNYAQFTVEESSILEQYYNKLQSTQKPQYIQYQQYNIVMQVKSNKYDCSMIDSKNQSLKYKMYRDKSTGNNNASSTSSISIQSSKTPTVNNNNNNNNDIEMIDINIPPSIINTQQRGQQQQQQINDNNNNNLFSNLPQQIGQQQPPINNNNNNNSLLNPPQQQINIGRILQQLQQLPNNYNNYNIKQLMATLQQLNNNNNNQQQNVFNNNQQQNRNNQLPIYDIIVKDGGKNIVNNGIIIESPHKNKSKSLQLQYPGNCNCINHSNQALTVYRRSQYGKLNVDMRNINRHMLKHFVNDRFVGFTILCNVNGCNKRLMITKQNDKIVKDHFKFHIDTMMNDLNVITSYDAAMPLAVAQKIYFKFGRNIQNCIAYIKQQQQQQQQINNDNNNNLFSNLPQQFGQQQQKQYNDNNNNLLSNTQQIGQQQINNVNNNNNRAYDFV